MGCSATSNNFNSNFSNSAKAGISPNLLASNGQTAFTMAGLVSNSKWGLALVTAALAAIVFAPQIFLLTGTMCQGFGFNPQVKVSGAPTVGLFLVLAVVYFLLLRLLYQWIPICPLDRWRYTVISTIIALLIFAPFLTSAFATLLSGGMSDWLGVIFLVELVLFFLIVRLSFL